MLLLKDSLRALSFSLDNQIQLQIPPSPHRRRLYQKLMFREILSSLKHLEWDYQKEFKPIQCGIVELTVELNTPLVGTKYMVIHSAWALWGILDDALKVEMANHAKMAGDESGITQGNL